MTAAFAILLAASMPAVAQTTSNTSTTASPPATMTSPAPSTPSASAGENHVMPGQLRFTDMNGATVYDPQNNSIGDINNVVLDRDGKVAAVVIKTGAFLGIGGKTVAVGMNDLKVASGDNGKPRFTLDMTKDQLKSAQEFDTSLPKNTATGSSAPPANPNRK